MIHILQDKHIKLRDHSGEEVMRLVEPVETRGMGVAELKIYEMQPWFTAESLKKFGKDCQKFAAFLEKREKEYGNE